MGAFFDYARFLIDDCANLLQVTDDGEMAQSLLASCLADGGFQKEAVACAYARYRNPCIANCSIYRNPDGR